MKNNYDWNKFVKDAVNNNLLQKISDHTISGKKISESGIRKDHYVLTCCMSHIISKVEKTPVLMESAYTSRILLGNYCNAPVVYNVTHGYNIVPFGILKYETDENDSKIKCTSFDFGKNRKRIEPVMKRHVEEKIETPIRRNGIRIVHGFIYDDELASMLSEMV